MHEAFIITCIEIHAQLSCHDIQKNCFHKLFNLSPVTGGVLDWRSHTVNVYGESEGPECGKE